jgi:hypothetical protein
MPPCLRRRTWTNHREAAADGSGSEATVTPPRYSRAHGCLPRPRPPHSCDFVSSHSLRIASRLSAPSDGLRLHTAPRRAFALDAGRHAVRRSVGVVKAKGAGKQLVEGPTKTGRSRVVHLDSGTVAALRVYRAARRLLALDPVPDSAPYSATSTAPADTPSGSLAASSATSSGLAGRSERNNCRRSGWTTSATPMPACCSRTACR